MAFINILEYANEVISYSTTTRKDLSNFIIDDINNMLGWWFDDRLVLKAVCLQCFFMIFHLSLRDFINMNEYAN